MSALFHKCRRTLVVACLLSAVACAAAGRVHAAQGDCGQPQSGGSVPTTSDCLVVLRVSVGLDECDPPCICDVNSTTTVTTTDALLCLKKAVGQDVQLTCPCPGQSTTTTGIATTSTTNSTTTTTTTPPSTTTTTVLNQQCPERLNLVFLGGIRGACATNADCIAGSCDDSLGRCTTQTELDLGWTGSFHDADLNDSVRLLTTLQCTGNAPVCGNCDIGGLDAAARTCRCENDNRRVCNQPFTSDADDCDGATCECYFGPPLPLSGANTPLCLVNRLFGDVTGTLDPDNGELVLNMDLRSLVFSGDTLLSPCPSCGGRCLAPAAKLDFPCARSSDCDTDDEGGTCGRFDEVAGDGVRGGLCVGGPDAGFGCDVDAFNTTFPAPGGNGYSLDCFPAVGHNISGVGLAVRLHESTADQSIDSGVDCGFPAIPELKRSCPCGVCGDALGSPCSSNADCEPPAACAAPPGAAFPNSCDDEVCTANEAGEGVCLNGPSHHFCDQVLRASGRGFLICQTNADCDEAVIGVAAGSCTLDEPQECFPATITAGGRADPQSALTAAVSCVPPTSNGPVNNSIGLPGAARLRSEISTAAYCDASLTSVYVPAQGCQ